MKRIFLGLRIIVEGIIGFWLLIFLPFLAVDIIRGRSPAAYMLAALLVICLLFLLGLLLFRDAVRLRIRQKKTPIS